MGDSNNTRSSMAEAAEDTGGEPKVNVITVARLAAIDGCKPSPIDLRLQKMKAIALPRLQWHNYDLVPKKMKITNTGITAIVSGRWMQERCFLSGGPLLRSYVFSQLHFHWGASDREGSEHLVDGHRMPMEMHVMHFKSRYLTQEAALKEPDGLCVLVFLFKLQEQPNTNLERITQLLGKVQNPHSSVHLEPQPLSRFLARQFSEDYFLYWGSTDTLHCRHAVLWLVCREPTGISPEQVAMFRELQNLDGKPLLRNFREVNLEDDRTVYHVLPGHERTSVLRQSF
ncbi:carbonic anhydrase 13-like [Bacillus rossius redtenbacheri]|uniref:carbonic anhydrase 13-like n=1 Tax=Bacillus rossius redtenbacheri TaxID=93214 RepID=UPI002FDD0900